MPILPFRRADQLPHCDDIAALAHLPPAVADLFAYDSYPRIADPGLVAIDLVVGLLLVAASEELAFRGLLPALLEKLTTSPVLIVLVSAVVFGLLHLRFGLGSAINATLLGLASASSRWRHGGFGLLSSHTT